MKLRLIAETTVANPNTALRLGGKLFGQVGNLTARPALRLVGLEKVWDMGQDIIRAIRGDVVSRNDLRQFRHSHNQLSPKDKQRFWKELDQRDQQDLQRVIDQEDHRVQNPQDTQYDGKVPSQD